MFLNDFWKNSKLKIVFVCDIDGTIIPQEFNSGDVKNYSKLVKTFKNQVLSQKIIATLNQMKTYGELVFITGRGLDLKDTTHNLLKSFIKKSKIYFHDNKNNWTLEKYLDFKLEHIMKLSKIYDIIIILDDMLEVLKYIKNNFKDNKTSIMLMYTKYNKIEKDMICYKIL